MYNNSYCLPKCSVILKVIYTQTLSLVIVMLLYDLLTVDEEKGFIHLIISLSAESCTDFIAHVEH